MRNGGAAIEPRKRGVIISLENGMPLRIDSHFTSNTPFATEHAFEIWETDRAKIQKPDAKPDLPW